LIISRKENESKKKEKKRKVKEKKDKRKRNKQEKSKQYLPMLFVKPIQCDVFKLTFRSFNNFHIDVQE